MIQCILLFLFTTISVFSFDHSHTTFDGLLKKFVSNGKVDYKGLLDQPSELNSYLTSLSAVSQSEYNQFSKEEKISFLINAYNAFTVQLILDNYPIKSIRKIGMLPLAAWRKDFFTLLGKERSLGWIEHEKLRKDFSEHRIHFAIVCASIGCPILINEAYVAKKLESQLSKSEKYFFSEKSKNRYDSAKKILYISEIFNWFKEDFTKGRTLPQYLQTQFSETLDPNAEIKYTDYDWNLNEK
jgi:hypothetical protein